MKATIVLSGAQYRALGKGDSVTVIIADRDLRPIGITIKAGDAVDPVEENTDVQVRAA